MKEDKKLDDKIKSSFESLNKRAPDMLWNQLSDSLHGPAESLADPQPENTRLYKKIRESFSSIQQKAPQHVWSSINRQLNIDLVWARISRELEVSPSATWQWGRWAAVLLLLMLSFSGGYYWYQQASSEAKAVAAVIPEASHEIEQETDQEAHLPYAGIEKRRQQQEEEPLSSGPKMQKGTQTAGKEEKGSVASFHSPPGEKHQNLPNSPQRSFQQDKDQKAAKNNKHIAGVSSGNNTPPTAGLALHHSSGSDPKENQHFPGTSNEEQKGFIEAKAGESPGFEKGSPITKGPFMASIPYEVDKLPLSLFEPDKSSIGLPPIAQEISNAASLLPKAEGEESLQADHFSFGPVLAYNNSWLLNNETRNSFDKGSLIASQPTYKHNLGLALHYAIDEKNTVTTEFHFISKAGQEYNTFSEGYYKQIGLELSYHKLYLQYQRNFLQNRTGLFSDLSLKTAFYGGLLRRKEGEIRENESIYSPYDFGLRLALGQEKRINRLIIGYGLSGERGLNNIFLGSGEMPARFNKTYIFNFGPYLNFRFNLKKPEKQDILNTL